jgi:hypothetical protein
MHVTITSSSIGNYSLGGEWWGAFSVNGEPVSSGDRIDITRNDRVTIYTEAMMYGTTGSPGSASNTITVTPDKFDYGFSVDQSISVRVYDGTLYHYVTWYITYRFSPY